MVAENAQQYSIGFPLLESDSYRSGGSGSLLSPGFRACKLHVLIDEGGEAAVRLLIVVSRDDVLSTMCSIPEASALHASPSNASAMVADLGRTDDDLAAL